MVAAVEQSAGVSSLENHLFLWFSTAHLPVEVQIGVARLELPLDLRVRTSGVPENVYLTARIVCNQQVLHTLPIGTHFASPDEYRNALVWDYILSFPLKVQNLSLDALLVITAWTSEDKVYGGTSMRLFDNNGVLKSGKQKLVFFFGREGDSNIESKNMTPGDSFYEEYKDADHGFLTEKKMENFRRRSLGVGVDDDDSVDWLDRLTLTQIQATLSESLCKDQSSRGAAAAADPAALDLQSLCCLVVELPVFAHPVLHEERPYQQVTPHFPMREQHTTFTNPGAHPCAIRGEKGQVEFSLAKGNFQGSMLAVVADWDLEGDNLAEEQNRKLNISTIRGSSDPNAKPNLEQQALLDRIISSSSAAGPSQRKLASADKDILYRFRYALTDNKKALTKVLLSVDWDSERERAEVPILLDMWKAKAPIDVADALQLLCNEREFQDPVIRQYAVNVLRSASDEELHLFLLQLVQALRYERLGDEGEEELEDSSSSLISPLAAFLFERAGASESLSLSLYWFLKVETDTQDDDSRTLYTGILSAFIKNLLVTGGVEGAAAAMQLQALDAYMSDIVACQREARKSASKRWMIGGRNDFVETSLNRLLIDNGLQRLPAGFESLPSPLDPGIRLLSLEKMSKMFKSALYPCVIDFNAAKARMRKERDGSGGGRDRDSITTAAVAAATGGSAVQGPAFTNRILFKCGDDLRQDQLIMHLFSLMDTLLKKVNLDLKLRTYGILAIGQKDGLMEFVESMPISGVETPRQTIFDYLQAHNPDPSDPTKIHPECLDTFIKSCAGSCVLTYILGVGDRHHDNIMLTKRGQLFHIDFGFVFGKDPKPLPPPFRLSRGMVDAMGGIESEGFVKFGKTCCQAFNWLRKSASVILNLISLMGDSGIPVIEQMGIDAVLEVVESRFRLNLSDEEAANYFLAIMQGTLQAIAPDVIDFFHALAVRMK